ncbi:MAG: uroporphyrinogen-III C-methyltransferase [Gammaproteobacteria bacterium]|nr:uroporphyrinogen-III C-methyltransferase [Gammaproteobacteria bacterium]
MTKDKASSDADKGTEVIATDPDPVQVGKPGEEDTEAPATVDTTDTDQVQLGAGEDNPSQGAENADDQGADHSDAAQPDAARPDAARPDAGQAEVAAESESAPGADDKAAGVEEPVVESEQKTAPPPPKKQRELPAGPGEPPRPKPRRSWFGFFNFLLILALAGAGGWYWWQQQQVARDYEATIADLRAQIDSKAESSALAAGLRPLGSNIEALAQELERLDSGQQDLQVTSAKLFELYGRDKNDWQFAEVEYLMRIAQHRLILQDDFEGAAATLQAASDKIAEIGDPGMLPVRVSISEEIADLKTRRRPDLVGMTLVLAQLARQVPTLQPGFDVRTSQPDADADAPAPAEPSDWMDRLVGWVDSLVEIRHEAGQPSEIEASIVDVGETLEDNLKLARWAVLDRDAWQYDQLIAQSLRLFREFYDLDHAANNDFHDQLKQLEQTRLHAQKPDITGSLRQLQKILSQRKNAPVETAPAPAVDEEASDA